MAQSATSLVLAAGLLLLPVVDPQGCPGGAVSYANVSSYAGCKEVNGNLILTGAFLTNVSADDLNTLSSIEAIDGYLLVSYTNLTNLRFLRNLRVLYGTEAIVFRTLRYTLVVEYNNLLQSYNFASIQLISGGGVLSLFNPSLCFLSNVDFNRYIDGNSFSNHIDPETNANCTGLTCDPVCQNWCWGPYPDECARGCLNYNFNGLCVLQCNQSVSYPDIISKQCMSNTLSTSIPLPPSTEVLPVMSAPSQAPSPQIESTPFATSTPSMATIETTPTTMPYSTPATTSNPLPISIQPSPVATTDWYTSVTVSSLAAVTGVDNNSALVPSTLSSSLLLLTAVIIIISVAAGCMCWKHFKARTRVHVIGEYRRLKRSKNILPVLLINVSQSLNLPPNTLQSIDRESVAKQQPSITECQGESPSDNDITPPTMLTVFDKGPPLNASMDNPPFLPMQPVDEKDSSVSTSLHNGGRSSVICDPSSYPNVYSTVGMDSRHKNRPFSTPSSRATSPLDLMAASSPDHHHQL